MRTSTARPILQSGRCRENEQWVYSLTSSEDITAIRRATTMDSVRCKQEPTPYWHGRQRTQGGKTTAASANQNGSRKTKNRLLTSPYCRTLRLGQKASTTTISITEHKSKSENHWHLPYAPSSTTIGKLRGGGKRRWESQ